MDDDISVILYRHGDEVTVMLERCPHQSGPLGEGEVQEIDGHACVVCPWHGSAFRLNGGEVMQGPPATTSRSCPLGSRTAYYRPACPDTGCSSGGGVPLAVRTGAGCR
ncbi:Rieske (2Fe-2S) protein [Micromonospora sp. M12]